MNRWKVMQRRRTRKSTEGVGKTHTAQAEQLIVGRLRRGERGQGLVKEQGRWPAAAAAITILGWMDSNLSVSITKIIAPGRGIPYKCSQFSAIKVSNYITFHIRFAFLSIPRSLDTCTLCVCVYAYVYANIGLRAYVCVQIFGCVYNYV